MGATVLEIPPWAGYLETRIGKPVRSAAAFAMSLNWLMGRGGTLIPWTRIGGNTSLGVGASQTLRFTIYPRYQATHRMWLVTGRSLFSVPVQFTDPSGGTSILTFGNESALLSADDPSIPRVHIETITSRVDVATHVEVGLEVPAGSIDGADIHSIACFELPRTSLEIGGSDFGVDQGTLVGARPIFEGTGGMSIGGVGATVEEARSVAKRGAHFHYVVFAGSGGGAVVDTTVVATEFFAARPPVIERFLYDGETRATVPVWAYTRSGASASGSIILTMSNGDTCTFTVPTGDAGTWRDDTLLVHVEDLAATDGRRSAIWDQLKVEVVSTGTGAFYLESLMLGPRNV